MERTVPSTASEEVELYLRTYYSLLRSTAEVKIRSLEEVHTGVRSLLHPGARESRPDMEALIYSVLRLPTCMPEVHIVVLGQSAKVFETAGFEDISSWEEVFAPARRRRCFFDGKHTLACFIASRSDIDDIIPMLTAFQIEWNKFHQRLQNIPEPRALSEMCATMSGYSRLADILEIPVEDFDRLFAIWDEDFGDNLERIASQPCDLKVQLLSGSLSEYRRARNAWWNNIEDTVPELSERPVYFVSSNTRMSWFVSWSVRTILVCFTNGTTSSLGGLTPTRKIFFIMCSGNISRLQKGVAWSKNSRSMTADWVSSA
jgi:hypothetical protein